MKRLMISVFAAVALLGAATTMPRSHAPSVDQPAGILSLHGFLAATDVSKLPIEDFDDQSLVYSKRAR
jgi:hypothetical protein